MKLENLVASGATTDRSEYTVLSHSEALDIKTECTRSATGIGGEQLEEEYCTNENYVVYAVGEGCSINSFNEDLTATGQQLHFEGSSVVSRF